jgi:hypothetical protein
MISDPNRWNAGSAAVWLVLFLLPALAARSQARKSFIEVETGGVFAGYCDLAIPGDTGTRFSLTDDLSIESSLFLRLRAGLALGARHSIILLYAPLSLEGSGRVPYAINFFGVAFPADTPLRSVYRFNSYRLTYRYGLKDDEQLKIGVGFTAKIRDAAIGLGGGGRESEKTNVGFVPVLNFLLEWRFSPAWRLLLEGDALAAPQGRAEDVFVGLVYQKNQDWASKAGYRILEGGADNPEVYNFALLNYLTVGAILYF